ncbi:unnamed protein product [Caenorhabditis bovis]|uniref:CCHC-type domain-containing protein n=1 Tax=Caenorhabditis bovis TaxID=2654633 RepID=A0A8S1EQ16_9PELO|nr:unnamed protein product [Caenorhabditis bovis]
MFRTYPNNASRKDRCREFDLCYQCLRGGHRATTCPDRCKRCRGRHHLSNMIPIPAHGAPPWRRGGQPQSNEFCPFKLLGNVSTTELPNGLQLHQTKCGPLLSGNEHHFTTLLGTSETMADPDDNESITRTCAETPDTDKPRRRSSNRKSTMSSLSNRRAPPSTIGRWLGSRKSKVAPPKAGRPGTASGVPQEGGANEAPPQSSCAYGWRGSKQGRELGSCGSDTWSSSRECHG